MQKVESLAKVKALTGADRETDALIFRAMAGDFSSHWFTYRQVHYTNDTVPALTASIDATVDLLKQEVPGCAWSVTEPHSARKRKRKPDNVRIPFDAYIANNDDVGVPGHVFALTEGPTPAIALVGALLTALISQEQK